MYERRRQNYCCRLFRSAWQKQKTSQQSIKLDFIELPLKFLRPEVADFTHIYLSYESKKHRCHSYGTLVIGSIFPCENSRWYLIVYHQSYIQFMLCCWTLLAYFCGFFRVSIFVVRSNYDFFFDLMWFSRFCAIKFSTNNGSPNRISFIYSIICKWKKNNLIFMASFNLVECFPCILVVHYT